MTTPLTTLVAVAVGYLVGMLPIANSVARRHGVSDLREIGDGNPGFWNAMQSIGVPAALPIFVGDVAKGAAGASIGLVLATDGQWWMAYVGAGAAMIGHAFPAIAQFKGGRSVLTFVGGALVAAPFPGVVAVGFAAVAWAVTRRFDWAARLGVASFPIVQIFMQGPERTAATGALMTFVGLRFATAAIERRDGQRFG